MSRLAAETVRMTFASESQTLLLTVISQWPACELARQRGSQGRLDISPNLLPAPQAERRSWVRPGSCLSRSVTDQRPVRVAPSLERRSDGDPRGAV